LIEFEKEIFILNSIRNRKKVKIILHVGTPKTGTTSLQLYLYENKKLLNENGYSYPNVFNVEPKHQWMITNLLEENFINFCFNLSECYYDIKNNIHTIILSSEGIFNHWYDFSDTAKSFLALLAKMFNITVYCWFRDQVSYTESYYKQVLKNPQMKHVKCYGKNLSIAELLQDKWFLNHLDYYKFAYECSKIFKKDNIRLFNYKSQVINEFLESLNISICEIVSKKENIGLSDISCNLLKSINNYNIKIEKKTEILRNLTKIDAILAEYTTTKIISEEEMKYIKKITYESNKKLYDNFNFETIG